MQASQLVSIDRYVRQQQHELAITTSPQRQQQISSVNRSDRYLVQQQQNNNTTTHHNQLSPVIPSSSEDDDEDDRTSIDWSSPTRKNNNNNSNNIDFPFLAGDPSLAPKQIYHGSNNNNRHGSNNKIGLIASRPPFNAHSASNIGAAMKRVKNTRQSDFVEWAKQPKVFENRTESSSFNATKNPFKSLAQSFSIGQDDDDEKAPVNNNNSSKRPNTSSTIMKKKNDSMMSSPSPGARQVVDSFGFVQTPRVNIINSYSSSLPSSPSATKNSNTRQIISSLKSLQKEISLAPSKVEEDQRQQELEEKEQREQLKTAPNNNNNNQNTHHQPTSTMMMMKNKMKKSGSHHQNQHHTFVNNFFEYEGEIEDGSSSSNKNNKRKSSSPRSSFVKDDVSACGPPVPHGRGSLRLKDGTTLEGTFLHGELTCDDGIKKWPNGTVYRGGFLQGEPHGKQGMLLSALTGDRYEGEFAAGFYNGKGDLIFRTTEKKNNTISLNRYTGLFRNNKFDGRGVLVQSMNESVLRAVFKNGFPSGTCYVEFQKTGDSMTIMEFPDLHAEDQHHFHHQSPERVLDVDAFFSEQTKVTYSGPMMVAVSSSFGNRNNTDDDTTNNSNNNNTSESYFNYNSDFSAIINTTSNLQRCLTPQLLELESIAVNDTEEISSSGTTKSSNNNGRRKSSAAASNNNNIFHSIIQYMVLKARSDFALERIEELRDELISKQHDEQKAEEENNNNGDEGKKKTNSNSSPASKKRGNGNNNKQQDSSSSSSPKNKGQSSNRKSALSSTGERLSLDDEELMLLSNIISPLDEVTYLDMYQLRWDGATSTNKDNNTNNTNDFQASTFSSSQQQQQSQKRNGNGNSNNKHDSNALQQREAEDQAAMIMTMSTLMNSSMMLKKSVMNNNNANMSMMMTNKNFAAASTVITKMPKGALISASSSPQRRNNNNVNTTASSTTSLSPSSALQKRNAVFLEWLFKNINEKSCGVFEMVKLQDKDSQQQHRIPSSSSSPPRQPLQKQQQQQQQAIWCQDLFAKYRLTFKIGTKETVPPQKRTHQSPTSFNNNPVQRGISPSSYSPTLTTINNRPLSSSSSVSKQQNQPRSVIVRTPSEMGNVINNASITSVPTSGRSSTTASHHINTNSRGGASSSPMSLNTTTTMTATMMTPEEIIKQDVLQNVVECPWNFIPSEMTMKVKPTSVVQETGRLFQLRVFKVNVDFIHQKLNDLMMDYSNNNNNNNSSSSLSSASRRGSTIGGGGGDAGAQQNNHEIATVHKMIKKLFLSSSEANNNNNTENNDHEPSWEADLLEQGFLQPVPLLDTRRKSLIGNQHNNSNNAKTKTENSDHHHDQDQDDEEDDDIFSHQEHQQLSSLHEEESLGKTARDFVFMKEDAEMKELKKRASDLTEVKRALKRSKNAKRRRSSTTKLITSADEINELLLLSSPARRSDRGEESTSRDNSPLSTARSTAMKDKKVSFINGSSPNNNNRFEQDGYDNENIDDDDEDDDFKINNDDDDDSLSSGSSPVSSPAGNKKKDVDDHRYPSWNHTIFPVVAEKDDFTLRNVSSEKGMLDVSFIPLYYRSFAQDEPRQQVQLNLMNQINNNSNSSNSSNQQPFYTNRKPYKNPNNLNFENFFCPMEEQCQFIVQIREQQQQKPDDKMTTTSSSSAASSLVQMIPGKESSCKRVNSSVFEKRVNINVMMR